MEQIKAIIKAKDPILVINLLITVGHKHQDNIIKFNSQITAATITISAATTVNSSNKGNLTKPKRSLRTIILSCPNLRIQTKSRRLISTKLLQMDFLFRVPLKDQF